MSDLYKKEVIDPGDRASQLGRDICFASHNNCGAVVIVAHQPNSFRGPVGFTWKPHILSEMAKNTSTDWVMLEEIENDGAGGKPQFFTLEGTPEVFKGLGWEIITMTADDFARSGRFPAVIVNELNTKKITEENFPLFSACMQGYGDALQKAHLVNITGEIAIMKHSVTAFCDDGSNSQFILTWGAAVTGLAYRKFLIDGSGIRPNMPVVGFWEPGYRCNGGTFFTNLLLKKFGPDIKDIRQNPRAMGLVKKLTTPSLSYARTICRLVGWNDDGSPGEPLANIAGIAHITGGGVWGKFAEILPDGVGAVLDGMPEPAQVLFEAQDLSWDLGKLRLSDYQAYGTLHGGCGMLMVCYNMNEAEKILKEVKKDGLKADIVGMTTDARKEKTKLRITSRFLEGKVLTLENPE